MNTLESLNTITTQKNKEYLSNFQRKLSLKISNKISDLLINYNIAKPKYTYFKKDGVEFNINYFFGFSDNSYQDFEQIYKTYLDRMPSELYPIASVDGGDLLCLDKTTESIYYWFHEEDDWGLEGNNKWPTKVSKDLNEFLDSLLPSEKPTEEEIERAKKQAKITKTTPIALKFKNEARAKKGLPPLTMEDF